MNRILTIDCWETLLKGSPDKERIIYYTAKRLRVDFNVLKKAIESTDTRLGSIMHKTSQYQYWLMIAKAYQEVSRTVIDPLAGMRAYNDIFEEYVPTCINVDVWRNIVNHAIFLKYEIRILSNVGYLRSDQLEVLINKTFKFRDHIKVIGSDLVGEAKPSKEFYTKALPMFNKDEDKWVHIGDDEELDIKPVEELGGEAIKFIGWDTFDKVDIATILEKDE